MPEPPRPTSWRCWTRRWAAARVLRACTVELVSRRKAPALIRRHELLGTVGNASRLFGLRGPDDRILSLVGFGHVPNGAGTDCDAVLERGFTWRRAPHNAASYLISRALRWGTRYLGWRKVKALSDPSFGEQGLAYKAAGFRRCPLSKHREVARAAGASILRIPERQAWLWSR